LSDGVAGVCETLKKRSAHPAQNISITVEFVLDRELGNLGLTGRLVPELGKLDQLKYL
jgi:hypothetical protein